jgi:hypothetical protein
VTRRPCDVHDPDAYAFCLSAALVRAGADAKAHALIRNELGPVNLPEWNDQPERTRDDVIAVLDQVLATGYHS